MSRIDFAQVDEGRYDRHGLIQWWDQAVLARASVIVAGAGALGNEVLKLLALMGFGHVLVVDFDTVSRSNLARTVLFREGDIGRPKVEVASERVLELNSDVDIRGIQGDLRFDVGLGDFRDSDVVVGCLDSVNARWALNRMCFQAGVQWLDGGISDFHGHVARYHPRTAACYECTFTDATYERFNRRYSCPYGLAKRVADNAAPTTAVTTSIIAALQVQEALYILHGLDGAGLSPGERLTVYVKPYRMLRDRLPQNDACLAHSTYPDAIPRVRLPSEPATVEDALVVAQQYMPGADHLRLRHDLVTEFHCVNCDGRQKVLKPKGRVYEDEARCPACGWMRIPDVISSVATTSPLVNMPLRSIGIPPRDILVFGRTHGSSAEQLHLHLES